MFTVTELKIMAFLALFWLAEVIILPPAQRAFNRASGSESGYPISFKEVVK